MIFCKYPELLGIPAWLGSLEEKIFEGLDIEGAKNWVLDFSEAISEGQDLDKIKVPFIVFVLEQNIVRLNKLNHIDEEIRDKCIAANVEMIKAQLSGSKEGISLAWSAAESAAESAAWSAAWSARSAAESAAESAAWSAWSARSARSAAESAMSAEYKKFADKLIELIKQGS